MDDEATKRFMGLFYRQFLLAQGGGDAARAMQHAMCRMIEERNPFDRSKPRFSVLDWAPFVVYGASQIHEEDQTNGDNPDPSAAAEELSLSHQATAITTCKLCEEEKAVFFCSDCPEDQYLCAACHEHQHVLNPNAKMKLHQVTGL